MGDDRDFMKCCELMWVKGLICSKVPLKIAVRCKDAMPVAWF